MATLKIDTCANGQFCGTGMEDEFAEFRNLRSVSKITRTGGGERISGMEADVVLCAEDVNGNVFELILEDTTIFNENEGELYSPTVRSGVLP